eukprot:CAMPEP_0179181322 /NCGR_PEP_ID=MMETSP0796-20121207/89798_1 /TAXON_ID=73915 /ORGANISM="Pyrodinium bahamense, Strain pbaha01" /LENGTH=86 /DNA_ID=CAMNT_0020885085 /DNA_START=130 /DNA_END=387 /DNA_ORIENTATION=+
MSPWQAGGRCHKLCISCLVGVSADRRETRREDAQVALAEYDGEGHGPEAPELRLEQLGIEPRDGPRIVAESAAAEGAKHEGVVPVG